MSENAQVPCCMQYLLSYKECCTFKQQMLLYNDNTWNA